MLDVKKIKYSFVLSLALLFSFCFAGTITFNGTDYDCPNLSGSYSVTADSDIYDLVYMFSYMQYASGYFLTIYENDITSLDGFTCYGLYPDPDDVSVTDIFPLQEDLSDEYIFSSPMRVSIFFRDNGTIQFFANGSPGFISGSDFPMTITSNQYFGGPNTYFYYSYYNTATFLHLSKDVYEYNRSTGLLGNLLWSASDNGSGGRYLPFDTPLSSSEINDLVLELFNSQALVDNLSKNDTEFFIIYDENDVNSPFYAYFYNPDLIPTGYLYVSEESGPVDYYNINFEYNTPFVQYSYNVTEFFYSDGEFFYGGPTRWQDFNVYHFDYYDQPIIYSTRDIDFYLVNDGELQFTTSLNQDIYDSNNQLVTSSDALNKPKDNNSIWSMLYNLFNPPSNSPGEMSDIENAHQQIIDYSDTTSFWDIFSDNISLLDFTSVGWILVADNLLFSHFAGFLALCCFFITISRLMR